MKKFENWIKENINNDYFYHGSDNLFDKFDKKYIKDDGFHGKGFYFSTIDLQYGRYLYKVKLNIKKIFDIYSFYNLDEVKLICGNKYKEIENTILNDPEFEFNETVGGYVFYKFIGNERLIEVGYDGLSQDNIRVVFEPQQIDIIEIIDTNKN